MEFENGYIQIKTTIGGGLIDGMPVAASESWGVKIACHIQKNMQNNKGNYKDGTFTQFAFTIFLEMQVFEAKRIKLTNNRNELIKEFEVQSIEFLDLVQRVKIIV
jgi:hypothetical protein